MMDAFSGIAAFPRITAVKEHDKKFTAHLKLLSNRFIVFDKAYNHYQQFAQWTENGVFLLQE
jgi:hypothetical protein